jgi:lactate dehydrogenase-like 2-hydroxyacid dehydrogenase
MWVPSYWVAAGLAGLAGVDVEVVALGRDMGETGDVGPVKVPASVADVEFYVPSFFPSPASSAVLSEMRRLRVVQALTAGVDWIRPHVPPSVALCNARGAHDASTAEWVVAAMLGALRAFPLFSAEQAAGRWAYQGTDQLATKNVLIVGYGAIGAAVEQRLAGFEVTVQRGGRGGGGRARWPGLPTCRRCCPGPTWWCCSCRTPRRPRRWLTAASLPG